jgi:hypothetical protein
MKTMKTNVPVKRFLNSTSLLLICLLFGVAIKAQTYTTIANGAWSSASTWQGGSIPNATNITLTTVINIKHVVSYSGGNISNSGIIRVSNIGGVSPRLVIAGGVNITNNLTGRIYVTDGEFRQYRFVGGGESGIAQNGDFRNTGGYVSISNSFVEIARNWTNELAGLVVLNNSSLSIGEKYELKITAIDSLQYTSISIGMRGSGDFIANGLNAYYRSLRLEVASPAGHVDLNSGIINGSIDYITLRNHVTGVYSSGELTAGIAVITTGLTLGAYCVANALDYQPNSKITGAQSATCGLNYFPAGLYWGASQSSMNYTTSPVLISGTDLQVGATYKYEGSAPGIDAIVRIDSLRGGATVTKIDDNTGGLGYVEGFQPEVRSGPSIGESYAVFTVSYKITGTNVAHQMNTFSLTAVDIDGSATMKEFDELGMGPGAVASYSNPADITVTVTGPGTYRGTNSAGIERDGIDTISAINMLTVTNTNISSFTLKLGTVKTNTTQVSRQYGIYMKGFFYPNFTLPLKLTAFTAALNSKQDKVNLNWSTMSEINVSHFEIERSTDGNTYTHLALNFAASNSGSKHDYDYMDDVSSLSGVIYYRLKMVDIDGKYSYSNVRMVRIGRTNDKVVVINTFPNPVTSELRVTIPNSWQNKKVNYEVIANNGQLVSKNETGNASQTETINVSNLAPGFYIVKVSCNRETAQQKIIKQ